MSEPIRPQFDQPPPSPVLAYLRLMRFPNVFTAIADVAMGFLFVHHLDQLPALWPTLALLIVASALLYTAGMVLNDLFDLEIDRRERPFRPLPSGQISKSVAQKMAFLFLFNGVMLAAAAGLMQQSSNFASPWRSGVIAALLAGAILAYDGWLKNTPLGPLGMGACRLLNVLLGMSTLGIDLSGEVTYFGFHASCWIVAVGLGVYITGVTWFARGEAEESNTVQLMLASVVLVLGIVIMASFVRMPHPGKPPLLNPPQMVFILFGLMAAPLIRRILVAITDPQPANVQATVKQSVLSVIVWATCITLVTTGPIPGLVIASLMIPAFVLGRWVYST